MEELIELLVLILISGLVGALRRGQKERPVRESGAPKPPPGSRPVAFPMDPFDLFGESDEEEVEPLPADLAPAPVGRPPAPVGQPPAPVGQPPTPGPAGAPGPAGPFPVGVPAGMVGEPAGGQPSPGTLAAPRASVAGLAESSAAAGLERPGEEGPGLAALGGPDLGALRGAGPGTEVQPPAGSRPTRAVRFPRLAGNRGELARAVVLAEVLGPPRALRPYRYGYGAGGALRGPLPGPAWAAPAGRRPRTGPGPEAGG